MREIKFRGKRLNGKLKFNKSITRLENGSVRLGGYAVIPETVGQFRGLTDKNGVEIYEGDIVKVDIFTKNYCIVFGESKKWGASFQYKADFSIYYLTESFAKDCSVIGNIFDTPELL